MRKPALLGFAALLSVVCPLRAESPARLIVHPEAVELTGPAARHRILVTAVAENGQFTDVTRECKFSTLDAVVAVSAEGECTSRTDGQTEITVAHQGRSAVVKVTSRDTQKPWQPSFLNHVEPILTRL